MRRLYLLLLILVLACPERSPAQTKATPILAVEAIGHTSMMGKVLFTPDSRQLISVASDKTIRVWYVETGELLGVYRPPIGAGEDGQLISAALTKDGRWLAVAGNSGALDKNGAIYLIAYPPSGQAMRALRGHTGTVTSLDFSADGKFLVSGSGDNTARIWDVTSGKFVRSLTGHTAPVKGVAFAPDGKRVVTASFDKTVKLWNAATGKVESNLTAHEREAQCVAFSPDGKTFVTGGRDKSICVWEPNGKLRTRYKDLKGDILSLAFTPDSERVLVTRFGGDDRASLLDLGSGKEPVNFKKHRNTIFTGAVSPDGNLAATGGGDDDEIYIWKTSNGEPVVRLNSRGLGVWAVGWGKDGKSVGWGNVNAGKAFEAGSPLQRSFHLADLEFMDKPEAFRRASLARAPLTLDRNEEMTHLLMTQKEKTLASFTLGKYDRILSATMLPNNMAAAGAWSGLYLLDTRTGKQLRKYVGHTANVWAVSPSPDNRYLVSGSSDQTLRVWDPAFPQPLLSLFFADNDWIAWTPEGYYAASPGGEKLMGWHVNNGRDQLASFYPAAQFRKTLYRPDVIREVLDAGSVKVALARADKARGKAPADVADVGKVLPPTIAITTPDTAMTKVAKADVEIRATATSVGMHPVTAMRLLINGRPYQGAAATKKVANPKLGEVKETWAVQLKQGRNTIAVQAESAVSQGISEEVEVVFQPGTEPQGDKGRLFVLAVGISAYPDDLKLDNAARDAQVVADALKDKAKPIFRQVDAKVLADKNATRKEIAAALASLRETMTADDCAVVYLSGQGVVDSEGHFAFLPSDVDTKALSASGVPGTEIKKALQGIPGRVIFLLDAARTRPAGKVPSLTDDFVREVGADESGVVVLCATSGREVSRDMDAEKSSVFAQAFVDGVSGKGPKALDGSVHLHQLTRYMATRVEDLSKGRQHPAIVQPGGVKSYPLAKP
ncbi:MAG: caspase family protein [Gemmataceae bacterium]|nr:caspase family protein [Gemmataceae bacterium]